MQSANDIRTAFLDYFRRHGHEVVDSSPLVPRNDPTLMFVNSGMVQFKNVFTGAETRPYKRAVTAQKCVRAGGKHNDLENVGHTARHHTFFEMLGNFSFGDYFKDLAIELSWNLVTKEYGLAKDRLLVTVYAEDDDAFDLWKKIAGLPESKIIRIPTSDNFWAMGDTGPCGPCSEIFYDHGADIPGGPPGSPEEDGDRFIEIWNLVFMQYEQVTAEKRVDLPKPSVDTGMGLERTAAVLQGTNDNYKVDILRALIEASATATGTDPDGPGGVSHRVIADHLRASCFLIADGVLPSNEGRGYVLRRIMRRAMRHAHMLGAGEPVMWRLVPALVAQMGQHFTELGRAEALMTETLRLEETRFKAMLGRGLKLLEDETGKLGDRQPLPGEVAFKLYDTFGFPLDLTQDALKMQGRQVDTAGYDAAMRRQREEARKAWKGSGEAATETLWFDLRERLGATEFFGYGTEHAEGVITAIVENGKEAKSAKTGAEVAVIVSQTPFYGESGGQMGDSGLILSAGGVRIDVADTRRKLGDMHLHMGVVAKGTLKTGDAVELRVDRDRRARLRANHSATHLLHESLRRHLGDHVAQKGSLVSPDYLRFDFSHPRPVTVEELEEIEADVNGRIRENGETVTRLMTPDAAIEAGALALFGEKYGDEVRVVSMGAAGEAGKYFSTELCGGTHVRRGGDIGLFRITGESAVASGVRRIEAMTGAAALRWVVEHETLLAEAAASLKTGVGDLPARVAVLLEESKKLKRDLSEARRKLAAGGAAGAAAPEASEVGGVRFTARRVEDVPARELKPLVDSLKSQLGSGVAAVIAVNDGKASLVVGVTDDLTDRISAVDLVRAGSSAVGGKGGGGRPDMAQAGGPDGASAHHALKAIEDALAEAAGPVS
jgi:alanyl-tRNA synthetase